MLRHAARLALAGIAIGAIAAAGLSPLLDRLLFQTTPFDAALYVEVAVETPVRLSRKQKDLLRTFEREAEEGMQPESEGFFAKVKEFWSRAEEA